MSMFFRWLVFGLAALLFNFPLISTLLTSLKSEGEIVSNPSILIQSPTFANYVKIFEMADRFDILHFLWNSLVISALGAFFALLLAFPAAYVIVRTGFGRNWLLPFVLNLRALPLIIFAIPLYMMFQAVGLLDTLFGLALIMCIINLPLTLALLSSTLRNIPEELDDAARVDGASTLSIILRIILPLSVAAIASSSVLGFVYAWNEFLFGLMLTTKSATPITVGASFFFSASGGGVKWGVASAVIILSLLPPLVVGLLFYRSIGSSLTGGAVKG